MIRRGRIIWVLVAVALLAPATADARRDSAFAKAVLIDCDRGAAPAGRTAVFEGRITALSSATRMQMRFTLQAQTPGDVKWRAVPADGFGTWITAPPKLGRYLYDKTVEKLLAPASYRAVVQFRWRNARGHVVRSETATSAACKETDPRPNLKAKSLRVDPAVAAGRDRYVAVVANDGRSDAGPFDVAFTAAGMPLGIVSVPALAAGATTTVILPATACTPGDEVAVELDPGAAVDEADETDNEATDTC